LTLLNSIGEISKIDISIFANLKTFEIKRVAIKDVEGLQKLHQQIINFSAERSITNSNDLKDLIAQSKVNSTWKSLIKLSLSHNELSIIDIPFNAMPYIQHLNLKHNKIEVISTLAWLPNLKFLNLSFNKLTSVPKLSDKARKYLEVLLINDNLLEDIYGMARFDSLIELDISNNCLLHHSLLIPLSAQNSLIKLNLAGNPLFFNNKYRTTACGYLSKNCAKVSFHLDGKLLTKREKRQIGRFENTFSIFNRRLQLINSFNMSLMENIRINMRKRNNRRKFERLQ
jgi:Leucine-rich repeat (LRR) protein